MRRQSEAATALSMSDSANQNGDGLRLSPHPKNRLARYGPLILWATLIFIGSSDLLSASHTGAFLAKPLHWLLPNASEPTLATINFLLRKAGHFTEYAILAGFAARAFRTSSNQLLHSRWFWVSLLLVSVYSLSDEWHQSFVPTRTASIYDSMIDTLGGLTVLITLLFRSRRASL